MSKVVWQESPTTTTTTTATTTTIVAMITMIIRRHLQEKCKATYSAVGNRVEGVALSGGQGSGGEDGESDLHFCGVCVYVG